MLKVKEVVELLLAENQEAYLFLSSDGEGNRYAPVTRDFANLAFDEDGEFGLAELTDGDIAAGYSEDDIVVGSPAVILFPE